MTKGETYEEFVQKFEPKKTTDDCYTPEPVYDAVAGWVERRYGIPRERFVRPFWPGGDYEAEDYPEGCAVVDNPPFSILSRIKRFYRDRGVPFFLFAPALTCIGDGEFCAVCTGIQVTYENGAKVPTAFVTNMEPGVRLMTAPDLYRAVAEAARPEGRKELPKYAYPDHVVTAAMAARWSKYGVEVSVPASESVRISALDMQRTRGIGAYGGALLVSDRVATKCADAGSVADERATEAAAQEVAAARRAERWQLSPRELRIVAGLA